MQLDIVSQFERLRSFTCVVVLQYIGCVAICQYATRLVEEEAIEGAYGQDLSMPIMDAHAIRQLEFGCWKTFHASSTMV